MGTGSLPPPSPTGYLPASLRPSPTLRSSASSSSLSSSSSYDSDRQAAEDQLQWDESLRQLHLIFSVVALPFAAKWAGRKFAYWGAFSCRLSGGAVTEELMRDAAFGRYLDLGFGRRFWLGPAARWWEMVRGA